MTAATVVDASALAALLFDEPEAADVSRRLIGARLVAPTRLPIELADVCRTKCRRRPSSRTALVAAFARYRTLGIEKVAVDPEEVLALAPATDLTPYDAAYLWTARHLNAELITLDRQLAAAAAAPAA